MKRLTLFTALLCATFLTTSAQNMTSTSTKKPKIAVAIESGLPVGDAEKIYKAGLGGTAKVEIPLSDPFAVTVSGGYMSLFVEDALKPSLGDNAEFIPLKAGAKYYFGKKFYGEGEVGATIPTKSGSDAAFAYAPGLGVSLPVADKTAIDAGVRYEGWTKSGGDINQVALRVAVKF